MRRLLSSTANERQLVVGLMDSIQDGNMILQRSGSFSRRFPFNLPEYHFDISFLFLPPFNMIYVIGEGLSHSR